MKNLKVKFLVLVALSILIITALWYFRIWPFSCSGYIDLMPPASEPIWAKFCLDTPRVY